MFTVALTACGGGGGGGGSDATDNNVVVPPPVQAPVMPAGVWTGTVTADGVIYEAAGIIAPDGEARFITDGGEQTGLSLTLDGGSFSATGESYTYDGIYLGAGTASGSFTETTIAGTTESNGEVQSTFAFIQSDVTADGASLDAIKGNYSDLNQTASVAIDTDGVITGSDVDGCIYEGQVTIPNTDINVYELSLTISTCGEYDGDYSGLATYAQLFDDLQDKGFIFQVQSDSLIITDILVK